MEKKKPLHIRCPTCGHPEMTLEMCLYDEEWWHIYCEQCGTHAWGDVAPKRREDPPEYYPPQMGEDSYREMKWISLEESRRQQQEPDRFKDRAFLPRW